MKFVNRVRTSTVLFLSLGMVACAFNGGKDGWNYDGSASVKLMPTDIYLPVQERDEDGLALPYEAKPNPYEALTGRIDRDIIDRYINARRSFQAANYEAADKLLVELIDEQPGLSGPSVMRGDIALANGDLRQAVELYMAAIRVNPVNFNAYLRLAKAQRMRGHFSHAQNTYARALQRWPDGAELHLNLGVLYDIYLNQPLQAQAHMEAYQFLSGDNSGQVVAWLDEIRQRTGVSSVLKSPALLDEETANNTELLSQRMAASNSANEEE